MADFTSLTEMERLFSSTGIDLRTDTTGAGSTEADIVQQAIDWATATVESYTARYYLSDDIATHKWVTTRATVLACHYFSQRRGNPSLFAGLVNMVKEDLEKLANNEIIIPGVAPIQENLPALQNYNMNALYQHQKARVDLDNQVGGTYSDQPVDLFDYYWPP